MKTRLHIRLQPNARQNEVLGFQNDVLRLRVTAPPHEGRANKALIDLLSDSLNIPKSRIDILRGHATRDKLVVIEDLEPDEVRTRLEKPQTQ